MPILVNASNQDQYQPAPNGYNNAVCCDVIDLGEMETAWGKKHMVTLQFQLEKRDAENRPFMALKRYTATLNDRSTLKKDLESWRGKPFTAQELAGFDLETLIGINANLLIKQVQQDEKIYANIEGVLPPIDGKYKRQQVTPDYVRKINRPNYQESTEYARQTNDSARGVKQAPPQGKPSSVPPKSASISQVATSLYGNTTEPLNEDDELPF